MKTSNVAGTGIRWHDITYIYCPFPKIPVESPFSNTIEIVMTCLRELNCCVSEACNTSAIARLPLCLELALAASPNMRSRFLEYSRQIAILHLLHSGECSWHQLEHGKSRVTRTKNRSPNTCVDMGDESLLEACLVFSRGFNAASIVVSSCRVNNRVKINTRRPMASSAPSASPYTVLSFK